MNNGKWRMGKDIAAVLKKYPDLRVSNTQGCILEGTIDIEDSKGYFWGKYAIKIALPERFPYEFPKMFETGGKIPKEADWHIYDDGSCCTTVRINELLVAKNGITILKFLDEFGVPYLANHKHKELKGSYASGEFSHGIIGYLEFLQEKINTQHLDSVFKALEILIEKKVVDRNAACFCGSGKKYKKCHAVAMHELSFIPKNELLVLRTALINGC